MMSLLWLISTETPVFTQIKPDFYLVNENKFEYAYDGVIRGNKTKKELALVFTGDLFADGEHHIREVFAKFKIKTSFFLTGHFYRNPSFERIIYDLKDNGHYLGAHSDQHWLYCAWENRDSLLVSKEQFLSDLKNNYAVMERFGIHKSQARYFLPPFEWYNATISAWTHEFGLILLNYTPGTMSHTDWTHPELGKSYVTSEKIIESILTYESEHNDGLNGFILLLHIGADPRRKDKLYFHLEELVMNLVNKGYRFKRIDELLEQN